MNPYQDRPASAVLTPEELAEYEAAMAKYDEIKERLSATLTEAQRKLLWELEMALEGAEWIDEHGRWHDLLRQLPRYYPGLGPGLALTMQMICHGSEETLCCTPLLTPEPAP